ncbi:cell wall hydrolase [Sphingomonas jaspsi]|uniref:cell wall hydrolase n=1 Tax=Sphingomonas jaspsi TaxID=392409 RepID=UPI000683DDAE|nr:cell wall hydrolase [Sphingomonas jaspsi]
MNNLLRAGAKSLAAVALVVGLGSSAAMGQTLANNLPIVRAVATSVNQTVDSVADAVSAPAPTLDQLVEANKQGDPLDEQAQCLATAVYFEAMGESLQGQLAVANVVMNRASSAQYPTSWCGVVKQKAQFSFVRAGRFPRIDPNCEAWARAQAVARIASKKLMAALPSDVMWYHADYVAPKWRRNLTKVEKIGAHIFYRA